MAAERADLWEEGAWSGSPQERWRGQRFFGKQTVYSDLMSDAARYRFT